MYDTLRSVQTPEGIALRLPLAGPVARALAWLLDSLIRIAIFLALATITGVFGSLGMGFLAVASFVLWWFYNVLFEVYNSGQTPGKIALGLRVLHDDGTPVGWSAALIRNILRAVDFLPAFYGFGLIATLLSSDFKRLGDIVAGTVVVYVDKLRIPPPLPEVDAGAPPYPLEQEEQQAILSFAERSVTLTQERAEELALLSGPLVAQNPRPLHTLLGIARWIAGKR